MSSKTSRRIKIGLVGVGMVGEPIKRWFEEYKGYKLSKDLFCYDADPKKGYTDDVNNADIIFVAVPTPFNPDGSCNISIVEGAVKTIKDGKIIVIKSTITPGTVEQLQKDYPKKKFIFNPEFLTESQAWLDYIKPDRQIVATTAKSYTDAKELLALLPQAHFERPWSSDYTKKDINATEAELTKYASNVFGYLKVIYGNILADVSHAMTLDFVKRDIPAEVEYENIREALSADPRIGPAWLNVNHGNYSGAGGYCFPKDMAALISFMKKLAVASEKNKQVDKGLAVSLKKGVAVLEAVSEYNEQLLKWQGLTVRDVSLHDKEIVLHKHKPIRV